MSYHYKHFGEGFQVAAPAPQVLLFQELLEAHGVPVTLVRRKPSGMNPYGNPTYVESRHSSLCLAELDAGWGDSERGSVPMGGGRILLALWEALGELDSVELGGRRFRCVAVERHPSHLEARLEVEE